MSKGQKTVTHHTIPVITSKKLGKQYNLAGNDLSEARAKLQFLGYLQPIRTGSHTYELLKPAIPDTLYDMEIEYIASRFTYTLPQAYTDIKAQLADLTQEIEKKAATGYEPEIKAKFCQAHTDLRDALEALPDYIFPNDNEVTFFCLPIHDEVTAKYSPLSRQHRLENLTNLLQSIFNILAPADYYVASYIYAAIEILRDIRIPSVISERMAA